MATNLSSDECYELIGKIAVTSAHLEGAVFKLLSTLISTDYELTVRLTAGHRCSDLIALTKSLIHYRIKGAKAKKTVGLLNQASKAYDLRSHYIHASFTIPKKEKIAWVRLFKISRDRTQGIQPTLKTVTKSDLRKVIRGLETATRRLEKITGQLEPRITRHRQYTLNKPTLAWDHEGRVVFEDPNEGLVWESGSRFPILPPPKRRIRWRKSN
jgi:hypothetical protein